MTEEKVNHNNVKYPSTGQYRNVVRTIQQQARFVSYNEETKEALYDINKPCPVLECIATVKLHGTNASLIMFKDQTIYCQSKERLLSFGYDNAGFWSYMEGVDKVALFDHIKQVCSENNIEIKYPIIIAGEWAGSNIQRGVAVNGLPTFLSIFGIKIGDNWQPQEMFKDIKNHDKRIYNILDFPYWKFKIDFNKPEMYQNYMVDLVEKVEQECPVGKYFGNLGIGEGIVVKPCDPEFCNNSGYWWKVKGEKHSVSKVKKLASVDTEKLNSITEFVNYAVTEARLEQALSEVGLDQKKFGEMIKWINLDIIKEESDTLFDNQLTMKDVGSSVATKVRQWYSLKLQEM